MSGNQFPLFDSLSTLISDKNEYLSPTQIEYCVREIKTFDRNKDGILDDAEFKRLHRYQQAIIAFEAIKRADKDRDFKISEAELDKAKTSVRKSLKNSNKRSLAKYDKDGDGKISKNERSNPKTNQAKKPKKQPKKKAPAKVGKQPKKADPAKKEEGLEW